MQPAFVHITMMSDHQQELQLLRALARIEEHKYTEAMLTLRSLQHDPIAGLAACTLILHAAAAAPDAIDTARDTLEASLPTAPPAALLLVASMHWLTGAHEAARALLERPAAAGDSAARALLAWVAVTHARQQRAAPSKVVLLGFDDDSDAANEARALCDQALAANPTSPGILVAAAHAHALCGQHAQAAAHAGQVCRMKQGWLPGVLAAAHVALVEGDWQGVVAAAGVHPPLPLRLLIGIATFIW